MEAPLAMPLYIPSTPNFVKIKQILTFYGAFVNVQ
jgi:hypothetical protein